MNESTAVNPAIAEMPRGGPNASWLDRRLQTDALGKAADPQMRVEFLVPTSRFGPTPIVVVFSRGPQA